MISHKQLRKFAALGALTAPLIVIGGTASAQLDFFKPPPPPKKSTATQPAQNPKAKQDSDKAVKPGTSDATPEHTIAQPTSVGSPQQQRADVTPEEVMGPVQAVDGTTIIIQGKRFPLSNIALAKADNARAMSWIAKWGGNAQCSRQPSETDPSRGYRCVLVQGYDVGLALAWNEAATVTGPPYQPITKMVALRHQAMAEADPAFQAFMAGQTVLDCQNPFSCGRKYIFGGWKENNALWNKGDLFGLVKNVLSVGYKEDITYIFLAMAAREFGAYSVAAKYAKQAVVLAGDNVSLDHCEHIEKAACAGIDKVAFYRKDYPVIVHYAGYEFN